MVIDKATIYLKAGSGGDGCISFMSNKGVRVGSGGDGSRGASIILRVSPHIYDLNKFRAKRNFKAKDGNRGMDSNKSGKTPGDLILDIPPGTIVRDKSGNVIYDAVDLGKTFVVARGGRAGKGNYKRRHASAGEPGEEKEVILDYRIPNDVAILGLPNSGKTSIFNALVDKHFKVSDYPFTTTFCVWAQFEFKFNVFTVLDMPALTDKSHENRGLGNTFLKHLYRTKIILVTADATGDYNNDFSVIRKQLELFDARVMNKKVFYLLTKADKIEDKGDISGFLKVSVNNKTSLEYLKGIIYNELFYEENSNKNRK